MHNTKQPEWHYGLPYQLQIVENNDIFLLKSDKEAACQCRRHRLDS